MVFQFFYFHEDYSVRNKFDVYVFIGRTDIDLTAMWTRPIWILDLIKQRERDRLLKKNDKIFPPTSTKRETPSHLKPLNTKKKKPNICLLVWWLFLSMNFKVGLLLGRRSVTVFTYIGSWSQTLLPLMYKASSTINTIMFIRWEHKHLKSCLYNDRQDNRIMT